jgi:phage shock protein PspC (stress-responsive transcriptional regulator)
MSIEQLIKKKEESMISGSIGGNGHFFLSWMAVLSFPFTLSFYIVGNPNSFSTK